MAPVKFGCMLETPRMPRYSSVSENARADADNQQGSRPKGLTPQRLHAELLDASVPVSRAYLFGALHDATLSDLHKTVRFGQSDVDWLNGVSILLDKLGVKSWMYREGVSRKLWILEASNRWMAGGCELDST